MSLQPGDKLGRYEIVALIGKGGMGEVWQARDPQLKRDVAIKTSHAAFSGRFQTESRAIAALNHTNICAIYDVGPDYLVMELIDGPTLAERIARGPIQMEEALGIATQIAAALEAAHDKAIVHRDLKPANIKIKPDGLVKVLDFGLAKAGAAQEVTSDSPTMTGTQAGMIMGTAGYMSPEQARGLEVDKRADIWAFGVVLYEMLTGNRLFDGPTVSDSLAAILTKEPDLSLVPEKMRWLLRACLEKDPKKRLRNIGSMEFLLDETSGTDSPAQADSPPHKAAWVAAGAFALIAAVLGFVAWRHYAEEPPQVLRMTLQTPEKAQLGNFYPPMISPDGRHVAFAASVDGKTGLWLRDLDKLSARQLPGTDGATWPFWSPDSRWVAFFAGRKLKKIDVTGGPALTLCDVYAGRGGTWNREGLIVYGTNGGGLFRVPAAGGAPTLLSRPETGASEASHRAPWFLPDGRHFLYTARSEDAQKTRIYVESVDAKPDSKARREILAADSNVVYVPQARGGLFGPDRGYVLFVRGTTLMAQPFDASKAITTGDAMTVAEQVNYFPLYSQGQFSASRNGILVYISGAPSGGGIQLTHFDRTGKPGGTVGTISPINWASISPDGSMIAADRQDAAGLWDIWLYDLARGAASRFTFGPSFSEFPVWSPGGSRIAFLSRRNGSQETLQKARSGVGQEEALHRDQQNHRVDDWSRDGRYLIEEVEDPKTSYDIWVIPTFGDKKPFPYINSEFNEGNAKLSPNGQFLAYISDESKRNEVYVQTFPEHGGKWQVSTGGGDFPVWSRDGRELYFISADNKMMAAEIKGDGKKFEASVPKPLFEVRQSAQFDVSRDGRFLIHVPVDQTATNVPLTVVINWQAALKK